MSSLNPTEVLAISALLGLRNSDHVVDFNVLSDLPIDSVDKLGNFDTQPIDTGFFFLNDNSEEKFIAPEGDSLPLYHFAEAETDVSVEDCGSSSNESESWAEYLAEISEESLSSVQVSEDGFFYEGDEEISGMGYDEASNSLWKDWTMNSMLDNDLEKAQSNTWIDEPLLNASLSETSSESGMDLLDWSIINDTFLDEKVSRPNGNLTGENANVSQQLKKRQNVRGRKSSNSVKARHQPARVGVTKILHHNKRDCLPQKIIKLRIGQKLVDLVNEWSEGNMEGNF
jgi:hypothetical protein